MYDFILVDSNAVGYMANSTRKLTNGDGEQTQAVFQSIKQMVKLRRENPAAQIVCLWDEHCQFRFDIYPEYKSKRDNDPKVAAQRELYRQQRPHIKQAFSLLGITQMSHPGLEADDVAYWLCKALSDKGLKILLITGDKDWLQLVSPLVTWHSLHTEKTVTPSNFTEETGFASASLFLQQKFLMGDSSDAIGGVGGIGEKTAAELINHFGGITGVIKAYKENGPFEKEDLPASLSRARNKINAFCSNENGGIEILKRNIALMDMSKSPKPKSLKTDRGKFDKEAALIFFEDFGFMSLVNAIDDIERAFG